MKKIFNILMLAAVVALTSCNYEPEGWHGTIIDVKSSEVVFDKSEINYMFSPEEGTIIEIPVSRGIATEAYTTTIEILDGEGNTIVGNPDYALMTIEQAKFDIDQYEAVATLTFDRRQFVAGTAVPFYLVLPETQINENVTVCELSILRDYTWNEYCGAVLESDFWAGMVGYPEVPNVVYKADGFPYYRVVNGLTKTIDLEFSMVDGQFALIGTPDSYGDVEFETGLKYDASHRFVRYCNVDPEYTLFLADDNAVASYSLYYVVGLGGYGYFQDVWYFDKPL